MSSNTRFACENEYGFRIQQKDPNNVNAVFLFVSKGNALSNVKVVLYDLRNGKAISENVVSLTTKELKVFENVPASLYTIYVGSPGCELIGIGGIKGIKID